MGEETIILNPILESAIYKIQNTNGLKVYIEVDFKNKSFEILNENKRGSFIFDNKKYIHRWHEIGELISCAALEGQNILNQYNNETEK